MATYMIDALQIISWLFQYNVQYIHNKTMFSQGDELFSMMIFRVFAK